MKKVRKWMGAVSDAEGSDGQDGHRKRRGRPPGEPGQKRDHNITFRTNSYIKEKLEKYAAYNGRSVSQEIEFILKIHFSGVPNEGKPDMDLIEDVLGEGNMLKIREAEKAQQLIIDKSHDMLNRLEKVQHDMIESAKNEARAQAKAEFDKVSSDFLEEIVKSVTDKVLKSAK